MKKNYTGRILLLLLLVMSVFACKQKQAAHDPMQEHKYTCPMHPQIVKDGPGQCPICGMDLVPMTTGNALPVDSSLLPLLKPSNGQIAENLPAITAESGTRIFSLPVQGVVNYDARRQVSISSRVSGRVEQLYIRYNFQPVRKGQVIMEIYSPDLAAAQREMIYISRNDNNPGLLQKARQRLSLLGMQSAQIDQVLRTGKPLYRVPVFSSVSGFIVDQSSLTAAPQTSTPMAGSGNTSAGSGMGEMGASANAAPVNAQPQVNNAPVMLREGQYVNAGQSVFRVYEASSMVADFYFDPALAAHIKKGDRLTYSLVNNPDEVFSGTIGLVEPVQRNGASFSTARVYVGNAALQPGQLISGRIPVVARGWWLPETAVVGLGNRTVVFKKEEGVFIPKYVPAGIRVAGLVQVLDSVGGWQVARNASYLVGSESFIRISENNQP